MTMSATSQPAPTARSEGAADDSGDPGSSDSSHADRNAHAGQAGASDPTDLAEPPEPGGGANATPVIDLHAELPTDHDLDLGWIAAHVQRAVDCIDAEFARIGIQLIDDPAMIVLHRDYCDLSTTTDVLTFPMSDVGEPVDVEIAICFDEAQRQAGRRQHSVEREILLYALHGLLHVTGYDDHDDAAYEAMHAEEDRILETIGVGRIFSNTPPGHDDACDDPSRDAEMRG
jgi:probable rRNA maturation factor